MPSAPDAANRSPVERALGLITEVRAGEGATALLLTLNVFLLLTAYYIIKPVREELILVMERGAEYKSYMSAAIAVALIFAVPAYARFAQRLPRNRLVVGVTVFFISHLVFFYGASSIASLRPYLGLLFFLWVGIFNMMVVAQFWAFANDVYTEEQGKRLFALIGLGASVGAAIGSTIAGIIREPIGVFQMLLVAAGLLGVCAFLTQVVHLRESGAHPARPEPARVDGAAKPEPSKSGAFRMVLEHRYLTAIAVFSLLFSWVNTNGEYMYGKLLKAHAKEQSQAVSVAEASAWADGAGSARVRAAFEAAQQGGASPHAGMTFEAAKPAIAHELLKAERAGALINEGYNALFLWVNIVGVLLQMFVVSRLIKYVGMSRAFLIFPAIALLDGVAVALLPALAVIRIGKTAENAVDYSLNNTLRNALWLPTTREMKYIAKQAVDTFFVRMGDVSSALLVFVGAELLGLVPRHFALVNVVLVAAWIAVAVRINRERERLSAESEARASAG